MSKRKCQEPDPEQGCPAQPLPWDSPVPRCILWVLGFSESYSFGSKGVICPWPKQHWVQSVEETLVQEAVQRCEGACESHLKLVVLGTHTQREGWLEKQSGAGGNGWKWAGGRRGPRLQRGTEAHGAMEQLGDSSSA